MKIPDAQQKALALLFKCASGENVWLHIHTPTNPLSLKTEDVLEVRCEGLDFDVFPDGHIEVWPEGECNEPISWDEAVTRGVLGCLPGFHWAWEPAKAGVS